MIYIWKPEKNEWLKTNRQISFEVVIEALLKGGFRGVISYKGSRKVHQGQKILLLEIDGVFWKVPHSIQDEFIFLRTIYPA